MDPLHKCEFSNVMETKYFIIFLPVRIPPISLFSSKDEFDTVKRKN